MVAPDAFPGAFFGAFLKAFLGAPPRVKSAEIAASPTVTRLGPQQPGLPESSKEKQ
jgi:hypothetical protein